jgi:hypothetical protein
MQCMPVSIKLIPISSAIKACVFKDQDCQLFYCGNYATNKLLLSRFSWTCLNSRKVNFFDFSFKSVYQAVIEKRHNKVPALERWSRILSRPIDHQWTAMFHYLHDPIINNRCKEILYKIYTQVLPVGTNIEKLVSQIIVASAMMKRTNFICLFVALGLKGYICGSMILSFGITVT